MKNAVRKQKQVSNKCPFCHGTGISEFIDFGKLSHLPNGKYDLNKLYEKYGENGQCVEGCKILN